jgi:hypothetical protein
LAWTGLGITTIAVVLTLMLRNAFYTSATLALAALAYAVAVLHFRLRIWLLAAAATAQLSALALIHYRVGLWRPADAALAFLPVTAATALLGLLIEWRRKEGSPFAGLRLTAANWSPEELQSLLAGWSRPLYLLLAIDLIIGQTAALANSGPGSLVSLGHAVLVAVLASVWVLPAGVVVAAGLGMLSLLQGMDWYSVPDTHRPVALALLALAYGLVGYGLTYARRREVPVPRWLHAWDRSLAWTGLGITLLALLWTAFLGAWDVAWLTIRALFEQPVLEPAQIPTVQMMVVVLAVVGLTYLAAALVERREWLGYGAVAMLLAAYGLELLLLFGQREVQWYAVPAGVYLLGIGYLEWREGRRALARWIDRTALLLLFGSAFWQSLLHDIWRGWPYAMLMVAEGLFVAWMGSARRQRRFLYAGFAAVVLAVVGLLGNQMARAGVSLGTAVVLGVIGLLMLLFALLVEWRLEAVKQRAQGLWKRLEEWE